MLSLIGDRVNSLRLPIVGKNLGRSDAAEARIWTAVTGRVMRRPAVSLALAGGFMVLAAVPVLGLHIGQSGVTALPGNLPSKQGYLAVQRYFPGQARTRSRSSRWEGPAPTGQPREAQSRARPRPTLRAPCHWGLA